MLSMNEIITAFENISSIMKIGIQQLSMVFLTWIKQTTKYE